MRYLKSDLALASFPLPAVQVHHEGFVTVLPVQSHVLMSLTERLDLILLHVRDDLRRETDAVTHLPRVTLLQQEKSFSDLETVEG